MGSSQPPNLTLVSDVEPASPNGAQSHHHKANLRIMELENEVVMLTGKATAQGELSKSSAKPQVSRVHVLPQP